MLENNHAQTDELRVRSLIAQRLVLARHKLGVSGAEVSRRLNLERTWVYRVEQKKTGVSAERLPRLAQVLGVDVSWFFTPIDPRPGQSMAARQRG